MNFLLYLVVVFFLLFNSFAASDKSLIQDSCKKVADTDPNLKYEFCVATLEENPASQNASLNGLVVISTNSAMSNMTNVQKKVENILKKKKYDKRSEMALRDCLEFYSDAKDSMVVALDSIKSGDYHTANIHFSSAMDAPRTCETGFEEGNNQKSPVAKENDVLFQMVLIPLAFALDELACSLLL